MRKILTVGYIAFLGLVTSPNVFADVSKVDTSSELQENIYGIMTKDYVDNIKEQKYLDAVDASKRAAKVEKEIEVQSANFLKFNKKIGEIFIPNPEVADIKLLSDKTLYLNGLTPGVTALVINDKDGRVLADYIIRVTYPLKDIRTAIKQIYPNLKVDFVSIDSHLLVKGEVASPEIADEVIGVVKRFIDESKIINKLTIQTATQVLLKVKVAEVTRDVSKSLGINWRSLYFNSAESGMIGVATGNTKGLPDFDAADDTTRKNIYAKLLDDTSGGKWIVGSGINNLTALIDATSTEKLTSVLAEPTLVALSGQSAKFNSGGEYGYLVTQQNSDNKTTEFKEWGTMIEFTPIVLSEDRINIKVSAEVSTVESNNNTSPSVAKKSVNTVVELGSGQSLALAGLLQKNSSVNTVRTPGLSDIPFVGSLFRSAKNEENERELVIVVTPYIINPTSKQLKTPVDMIPRLLSPLKIMATGGFYEGNNKADSFGFSLK